MGTFPDNRQERFMAEQIQQPPPHPVNAATSSVSMVATTARWLGFDDDLAFGCECADPALQIERWREEATSSPAGSS
jgi:hypothetical protein